MPAPGKLQTNADYLIVGGGMAGLSALTEARRLGISAICLEATPKPGGRTRTVRNRRLANYPIELGAEFVHSALMKKLCESLRLTLDKHPSDGVTYLDQQFLPLLPIVQVFSRLREQAAAHLAAGHEDCSVEEFVAALEQQARAWSPGVTGHLVLQFIRNGFAARVSDLSLPGLLAPDVDGYEDNYRIAEGYAEVPRRLAAGGDVRVNHLVTALVRHHDRVDVVTNRGLFSGNVSVAVKN